MTKSATIGVAILAASLGAVACKTKGLASGPDAADAGGSWVPDGAISTGGTLGTGGLAGTGGISGTTVPGMGGRQGVGGLIGTGGLLASGGRLGGTVGTGGLGAGGKAAGGVIGGGGGTLGRGGSTGVGAAPGSGGSTGKMCGGLAGLVCPEDQFCELPAGHCGGIPDDAGTCVDTGEISCPLIYAPVCGCDHKTYGNDCARQGVGVSKLSDGECPSMPACPEAIAQISGWPCTEGLVCEYRTDPRPECRTRVACTGGKWSASSVVCPALPPITCPDTREQAAGEVCPTEGAYCMYDDLACECTNCNTGGPAIICTGDPTWHCAAPNPDRTCPPGIPLLGSACATEEQTCRYACGNEGGRVCKVGAWYAADGGPCPVSTRRAKKDIVYLSAAARRRIADDLARFKLATYEYRDPALAGRRHLGFIIEDVPGSPAVARDGNMVDLYGYASMLVAAVQAQGEEIRKLKAELARLKQDARANVIRAQGR